MDLNDVFGDNPNRPDHPDFWKLSNVLLKMDSGMDGAASEEEREAQYLKRVQEIGIDPSVLSYASVQRVARSLENMPNNMPPQVKAMFGIMLAGVWLDGFAAGSFFTQDKQKEK